MEDRMKSNNEKQNEKNNIGKMSNNKNIESIKVDMRFQMKRMSYRVKRQRMLLF